MVHLNQMSSLEDKATVQVAINLCQDNCFKEEALLFQKPTYGSFSRKSISDYPIPFTVWTDIKEAKIEQDNFWYEELDPFLFPLTKIEENKKWDVIIDEQCQRLTEGLPRPLKHAVRRWMNQIALEYLSYSRRQELLFGVSRYFLKDVLTREDWTEGVRLDEKKVAERLIKDERLTVFQRYRIACAYCLHENIPHLWKRLHEEDKKSLYEDNIYEESHLLVSLWTEHMDQEKLLRPKTFSWRRAAELAVYCGNRAALMSCWKMLKEHARQEMVIDMALICFWQWQRISPPYLHQYGKKELLLHDLPTMPFQEDEEELFLFDFIPMQLQTDVKDYNLPSYYSELMRFFLSEMDEEQLLTFLEKAYSRRDSSFENFGSILDCFSRWPLQDEFLPMINRLWGTISEDEYEYYLFQLADMYGGKYEKENCYYDYGNLLCSLWEKTPDVYKRYVLRNKKYEIREHNVLLHLLLRKSPFQRKDEALFKIIFRDQPQEERRAMMRSEVGISICSLLAERERWSFMNWLLGECFPTEEIPSFKRDFIHSSVGYELCSVKVKANCEKLVEDLFEWCLSLNAEKTLFRHELVRDRSFVDACKLSFREENFSEVDRMINFCATSNEMYYRTKFHIASYACSDLLQRPYCMWELMDKIAAWSVKAEENVKDFKKKLFSCVGFDTHYEMVCIFRMWEKAEKFYKWFDLSPEEIKKLKQDTVFSSQFVEYMEDKSRQCKYSFLNSLQWCLTDEKMIVDFVKYAETKFFDKVLDARKKKAKVRFEYIVKKLRNGFNAKEVQKLTDHVSLDHDYGEKRTIASEDESSSPRKRMRWNI